MAKWRELGRRIAALEEIGEILTAMRSLAFIEVRHLAEGGGRRHDTITAIEAAAADLATHFPDAIPSAEPAFDVVVALGSERGLCGDHNEIVASALERADIAAVDRLLVVGTRLSRLLDERGTVHRALPGPLVVEDVPQALAGIVAAIGELARMEGGSIFGLVVLHLDDDGRVRTRNILPMPASPATPQWRGRPDVLLAPRRLYESLVDHYVFAALQVSLLASLLAESRKRLDQMGGALDRLHERLDGLGHDRRRARQEAITEEIEVILLGSLPVPPDTDEHPRE